MREISSKAPTRARLLMFSLKRTYWSLSEMQAGHMSLADAATRGM